MFIMSVREGPSTKTTQSRCLMSKSIQLKRGLQTVEKKNEMDILALNLICGKDNLHRQNLLNLVIYKFLYYISTFIVCEKEIAQGQFEVFSVLADI